jgi:CRISPR-associated exonuclease Cas4
MIPLAAILGVLAVLAGLAAVLWGLLTVGAARRNRRHGTLDAVDGPDGSGASFRSARYRLAGRPDEVRRTRDGRRIPVELKSRASPHQGPLRSHAVQVAAYCLLIEEATGLPPPYGVVRYGDGIEYRIPWDTGRRRQVLELLDTMRRPYRGEASASPTKCPRCRWFTGCTARSNG